MRTRLLHLIRRLAGAAVRISALVLAALAAADRSAGRGVAATARGIARAATATGRAVRTVCVAIVGAIGAAATAIGTGVHRAASAAARAARRAVAGIVGIAAAAGRAATAACRTAAGVTRAIVRATARAASATVRSVRAACAVALLWALAIRSFVARAGRRAAGRVAGAASAVAAAGHALGARARPASAAVGRAARWTYGALAESAGELVAVCRRGARWAASVTARGGRRLAIIVVLSTIVGMAAAAVNMGAVQLPMSQRSATDLHIAAATSHVMVDWPERSIIHRRALPQDIATLVKHAELMGRTMLTPAVLVDIGKRAGLPADQISGIARTTAPVPIALTEPASEQRASEIADSYTPYRLEVQSRPFTPILDIYAQAPTVEEAVRLADSATLGLRDHLDALAAKQDVESAQIVQMRQLGPAQGGMVNGKAPKVIIILTFLTGFCLTGLALVGAIRIYAYRKNAAAPAPAPSSAPLPALRSEPVHHGAGPHAPRRPAVPARIAAVVDDWPNTARVLPWMLAAFMALLWLVPFNSIQLNVSLPIDMKLDRLMLPFIIGTWILSIAVGGRSAPSLRVTWIHAALLGFVACAVLSVVLDAPYLNQTLEFELSLKKLPLLLSYVSVFLMFASIVRRTEVGAFLKYTLGLAVITALGIIYEYRFQQNMFTEISRAVLPGIFQFPAVAGQAVDSLGRPAIVGPGEVGLEAVSMLSMALPIALVALLRSERWRDRILYGIAACALVAATFATLRKSAILAPISVFATLAYFRRRELLRLAPLAMVLIVVVSAVSPGALGSTVSQFTRSDRSEVATVSDRTSDYDAVRPDLFSHLAFGRGWGTYNHESYRILDSEVLHRIVEMGIVGLLSFILVGMSVVLAARKTIAERDPMRAPHALVGAAAAICFLVLSTLYDVLSFPHATYIFLYIAGLVAVVIRRDDEVEADAEVALPARRFRLRPRRARRHAREPLVAGRTR